MMNELNDIAGQHETIAENIVTQILTDLTQLIQSLRQDRKRVSFPPAIPRLHTYKFSSRLEILLQPILISTFLLEMTTIHVTCYTVLDILVTYSFSNDVMA